MAPGSPLLSQPSPTKKSSQELPYYPLASRLPDASPTRGANYSNSASNANGLNGVHRANSLAVPEPVTAADLTPSVIADEMDVDSGTTAAQAASPAAPQVAQVAQAAQAPQATQQTRARRSPVKTPELQTTLPQRQLHHYYSSGHANGQQQQQQQQQQQHERGNGNGREPSSPSTPGHIPPFDWEEFEARYEQALADMNGQEKELLEEFDRLVNYFNVWASAASAHDDERAVKRLQTRERYVKIAEQSLGQRKQHLTEVVRAFQSALALLSQS